MWGLVPAWVGVLAFIILGLWITRQKNASLIMWLILAAGLSNIIDRLLYNGVIDWIHSFSWFPVFNLADMVITGGVGVLMIQELSKRK